MRAAVEDVHHRHRQQVGAWAAEVAEQREFGAACGGLRDRERDSENRVGAEPVLVRRAVEVEKGLVDQPLLAGLEPDKFRAEGVQHGVHRLLHALTPVSVAAVAQLHGLELPGGGTAGDGRAAERSVLERHLHLDRRISA